jgi:LysM repeat protein
VVLAACLVFVGAAATSVASVSLAADPGGVAEVAVVRPGDTLWSVAARHVPSDDPYRIIEEIRRLNGLSGHMIHAGQQLIMPAGH